MKKILLIGQCCADLVVEGFSKLPQKGTLSHVSRIAMTTGGCANNAAKALGALGADVTLCTLLGEDGFADVVRKDAVANGVKLNFVSTTQEAGTSSTVVLLHKDAERSFLNDEGTNALFGLKHIPFASLEGMDMALLAGLPLLSSFYGEECKKALAQLQKQGITTFLDLAFDPTDQWQEKVLPCLPYCDYFMPSDLEAQKVSGLKEPNDMAAFFLAKGAKHVLIKLGEKGCLYADKEKTFITPGIPVKALDATGAGDCFCAGFLYGLSVGLPVEDCVLLGNASGALCVTQLGATQGMRTFARVREFLKSHHRPLSSDQSESIS